MTAKEYFIEEISGEPLTQDSVVEGLQEYAELIAIEFAEFVATYSYKNRNYLGEMLHAKSKYDDTDTTKGLFDLFLQTKEYMNWAQQSGQLDDE